MIDLNGKRLLVLGGTGQQVKIVEAAKRRGVWCAVADYLPESPGKKIADASYCIDIKDIDALENLAHDISIDGVICGYIDPGQRPYQELCERLGVYCYGTRDQFWKMTDKPAFKALCRSHGVDVIPEYCIEDLEDMGTAFPVFVKPVDSRGSRGQAVCRSFEEAEHAIDCAKKESSNGQYIIEKYVEGAQEFQATYFVVDGVPYLVRTADSYTGDESSGLEKVVLGAVSPSRFTDVYLKRAHGVVVQMLKAIGLKNGPAFMQGFYDGECFRFFDPGLRFPGVDYERIYDRVFGIDLSEMLVELALTGRVESAGLPEDGALLNGSSAAVLFPTIKSGRVGDASSFDLIAKMRGVVSLIPRVETGDEIDWTYDVNQRACEVDVLADNLQDLAKIINDVNNSLSIKDAAGKEMRYRVFTGEQLLKSN